MNKSIKWKRNVITRQSVNKSKRYVKFFKHVCKSKSSKQEIPKA